MKDIFEQLFDKGDAEYLTIDLIDDLLYVVYKATLRPEHRGTVFVTNYFGNWNVSLEKMTVELWDAAGNILASAPIKISLDHTCTNHLTA